MADKQLFVVADGGSQKCGGCNWRVYRLYAYAESQEEADTLYRSGEAGLCGDCMCDLLVEESYQIGTN